jgi:hypothetical protein
MVEGKNTEVNPSKASSTMQESKSRIFNKKIAKRKFKVNKDYMMPVL